MSPGSHGPISGTCSGQAKSSVCGCFPSIICISTSALSPGRGKPFPPETSPNTKTPLSSATPDPTHHDLHPTGSLHSLPRPTVRRRQPLPTLHHDGSAGCHVLLPPDPPATAPAERDGRPH